MCSFLFVKFYKEITLATNFVYIYYKNLQFRYIVAFPVRWKQKMSRISSAKNHATNHDSVSSTALNTKYSKEREKDIRVSNVLVPCQNWKTQRSVWNNNELRRIKTASRVVTKEEIERRTEKFEADRDRQEWCSEQRKRFLRGIDEARELKFTKNRDECNDTKRVLDEAFFTTHEEVSVSDLQVI